MDGVVDALSQSVDLKEVQKARITDLRVELRGLLAQNAPQLLNSEASRDPVPAREISGTPRSRSYGLLGELPVERIISVARPPNEVEIPGPVRMDSSPSACSSDHQDMPWFRGGREFRGAPTFVCVSLDAAMYVPLCGSRRLWHGPSAP